MHRIAAGYKLPEALRADGGRVYFSDAIAGGVYMFDGTSVQTIVPKRRGVGGLALHSDGGVVITGRDLIHVLDGETRVIFAATGALGLNDLITDSVGGILVGSLRMDWRMPDSGSPGEVWRIARGLQPQVVADTILYPNGIGLTPDGGTLYVADYVAQCIHAFTLEDWRAVERRTVIEIPHGNPDGLALDVEGGIWVATGKGASLDRYSSEGRLTERITPPTHFVITFCFGGTDGCDLYIATADSTDEPDLGGSILFTRSPVAGMPISRAAV